MSLLVMQAEMGTHCVPMRLELSTGGSRPPALHSLFVGAYTHFNDVDEKADTSEVFYAADIEDILAKHSRIITHDESSKSFVICLTAGRCRYNMHSYECDVLLLAHFPVDGRILKLCLSV